MPDTLPDLGLSFPPDTFLVAYQRFVEDLERALGIDAAEGVAHAYQAYARVCEEALSESHVQKRVTSALGDLTAALNRAFEHPGARTAIDEAATSYLHEVGSAWAELSPHTDGVDAMMAVATGMTTLAWLFGLGSNPFLTPFGLGGPGLGGDWGGETNGFAQGAARGFAAGDEDIAVRVQDPPPVWHRAGDVDDADDADDADDGIVWQEFDVGEDGEIVQRPAARADPPPSRERAGRADAPLARSPARPTQAPRPAASAPSGGASTTPYGRAPSVATSDGHGDGHGDGSGHGDPVGRVRRAYAAYAGCLDPFGTPPAAAATHQRPAVEQHTAELLGAYLRLLGGSGTSLDQQLGHARLVDYATELLERQIALARRYEELIEAALHGQRPEYLRRAAEDRYRRLFATIRDAWSEIDPARHSPQALAELADLTGRAARLHETTAQARPQRRMA